MRNNYKHSFFRFIILTFNTFEQLHFIKFNFDNFPWLKNLIKKILKQ